MDEKPFLEVNLLDLKDNQIEDLKKFHKSYFDLDSILSSASELKYMGELKSVISREFTSPSPDFVKYLGKQVYESLFTPKVLDQFTPLVKRAISSYINDLISDRLKAAIKDDNNADTQIEQEQITDNKAASNTEINTTDEEKEAFYIVKSILRDVIPADRIAFRDAKSYCTVIIDDNNRKLICRLYLNSETTKKIVFLDENKKEISHKIESLDDIYNYSDQIKEIAEKFL